MAPAFSRLISPQSASPLFGRLSAEIRLNIYRNLLVPSDTARKEGRFVETDAQDDRVHLSAQLLSCCQRIYHECEAILYGENKVQIEVEEQSITIGGDVCLDFTSDPYKQSNLYPISRKAPTLTLLEYANQQKAIRAMNGDLTTLNGMLKMRHVNVHLRCSSRRPVYDYVRLLRDVVSNKSIVVHWAIDDKIPHKRSADILKSLHLWRCQSLTFKNLPSDLNAIVNPVRDLVTSNEPVKDLLNEAHQLYASIDAKPIMGTIKYTLGFNMGLRDTDESDDDKKLAARMLRDRLRRQRGETQQEDEEEKKEEELSTSKIPIGDIGAVWEAIRRGETEEFMLWKSEFVEMIRGISVWNAWMGNAK